MSSVSLATSDSRITRLLLFMLAVTYTPVFLLVRSAGSSYEDPVALHIAVSSASFLLLVLSYIFKRIKAALPVLSMFILYLLIAHAAYVNALNNFPSEYAITLFIMMFLGGIFQPKVKHLVIYEAVAMITLIVVVLIVKLNLFKTASLIAITISNSLIAYFFQLNRLRTASEIDESERKYRDLVNFVPIGIVETDLFGNIIYANPESYSIYGIEPGKMEKLNIADFIDNPGSKKLFKKQWSRFIKDPSMNRDLSLHHPGKNGAVMDLNLQWTVKKNARNKPTGFVIAIMDVTIQKDNEARIRRESEMNKTLAELYKPLVSQTSIRTIAQTVAEKAIKIAHSRDCFVSAIDPQTGANILFGVSGISDEMSRSFEAGIQPVFKKNLSGNYEGIFSFSLNERKPYILNNTLNHKFSKNMPSDHIKIHRILTVPVIAGDDLFGLIAVANSKIDYTDADVQALQRVAEFYALAVKRSRAETLRQESEELMKRIVTNAMDLIASVDHDGNILFFVGPDEYGFPLSDYTHKNISDLNLNQTNPQILINIRKVIETERPIFDEEKLEMNGLTYWFHEHIYPIRDDTGKVVSAGVIARNITHRKIAEEENLKLVNKLKESNEILQQFAYTASHDMKEPLRMIKSFLSLIRARLKEQGHYDNDIEEFIDFADDGSARMEELLNGLLSYSRVESRGNPFLRISSFDALRQALANLKVIIDEAKASIVYGDLPEVLADEIQMVQLFQNLIENAIKYAKPGIEPKIEVTSKNLGLEIEFEIRDNGIGIEPENFERIFKIYQRLHTREEIPGTGIGLAICKRIVERHEGKIRVESRPGEGSSFIFTLPARI